MTDHVTVPLQRAALLEQIAAVQTWEAIPPAITAIHAFAQAQDRKDTPAAFAVFEALSAKMLGLYRAFPEEGRTAFSIASLAVPPLFARWGFAPADRDAWVGLKASHGESELAASVIPMMWGLVVEGIADGRDAALARFIQRMSAAGFSERLRPINLKPAQLGEVLRRAGWYVAGSADLQSALARILAAYPHGDAQTYIALAAFLTDLLAFSNKADYAWLDFIAQNCLVPMIAAAAYNPQLSNLALQLEWFVYACLLKTFDSAENWKRSYETMAPALAAAGRAFGAARYGHQQTRTLPLDITPPRIAFFLWGDFSTAHAQMVYLFLRGLKKLPSPPVEVFIYVLEAPGKNLTYLLHEVEGLGVTVRHPEKTLGFSIAAVDWLRSNAAQDRIFALLFVSVTAMMSFAAGARVAPIHIQWSLKYHSLQIPEIEGYLGTALLQHRPASFGPHWRIGDAALPFRFDPSLTGEANALRAKYGAPDTVILGCLGRADKLRDPLYVGMLGRLMRAHPNTVYLWTGRSQPPDLVEMLGAEGILDRCRFIGWVNVRLYAQVLDIKIDSFPFASGHTCVETMAAGRPVVTLLTPESLESSTATSFMPLWEGRIGTPADHADIRAMFTDESGKTFAPFFDTVEAYEAFASRLIVEPEFRVRVGEACRRFAEKFLGDEKRMAATTAEQILAIIDEQRSKTH